VCTSASERDCSSILIRFPHVTTRGDSSHNARFGICFLYFNWQLSLRLNSECHFDRSHGRHNRRLISSSIKVVIDVSSCTKSLNELPITPIGIRDIGVCNSPNVPGQGEWTIAYTTVVVSTRRLSAVLLYPRGVMKSHFIAGYSSSVTSALSTYLPSRIGSRMPRGETWPCLRTEQQVLAWMGWWLSSWQSGVDVSAIGRVV
jgi:hypothetical protein